MTEFEIPNGFGIPLVNLATGTFPTPTMVALDARTDSAVGTHVAAPTPHPAYDDMADLTLLFENGLV